MRQPVSMSPEGGPANDAAETDARTREERRPVQVAPEGIGPLLQRDYVLTLEGSPCTPERVVELIRTDFPRFAPDALSKFTRTVGEGRPLEIGDTLHVRITGGGHAGVIVSQLDARSLTVRTQEGHMEAGRNTFGAYYDALGRLVLRIRSRSRIRDLPRSVGYWLFGKNAQAEVWCTYLRRLAEACGGHPIGDVAVTTVEVEDSPADAGEVELPTFCPWPESGDPSVGG